MNEQARPLFTHDCDHCVFLGRLDGVDLYFCGRRTVLYRYGNDGANYGSVTTADLARSAHNMTPDRAAHVAPYIEAKSRAIKRGLLDD